MKLIAIDPGDVHCGVAYFETTTEVRDGRDRIIRQDGWECTDTQEHLPGDLEDGLALALIDGDFDVIVLEQFNLYPDKAMAQTGSTMPTCEMIGCIKWAHRLDTRRRADRFAELNIRSRSKAIRDEAARNQNQVQFVLQPAAIQDPTAGLLRRRGIKSVAKQSWKAIQEAGGEGDHALSAELHGWHFILRPGTK